MPAWVGQGYSNYARRIPPEAHLSLIEIRPEKRDRPVDRLLKSEAARIVAAIPKNAEVVVLDERGSQIRTTELAGWLAGWAREARDIAFVIGGADGLDEQIKALARRTLALSALTLPHGLVRVVLAEQLYRAFSLLANHPYHREG